MRQEQIQLDIRVTDETRSFQQAIGATRELRNAFNEADKEVRKQQKSVQELEKQLSDANKTASERITIERKLTEARTKLTEATGQLDVKLKAVLESGKGFQGMDLSNVAPRMLETRLSQINSLLKQLPASIRESSPEAQALVREHQAIEKQIVAQKKALQGVREATKDVERDSVGFLGKLVIGVMAAQRAMDALMQPSKLASEIESTKIALETMLNSKVKAQKLITEVVTLAKDTPFETKPLVDYTKQLVNANIETNKIIPTLKNLGNVASGAGIENMSRIVTTYTQVASIGKLQGDNLKEFQQQNVPMLRTLAEMLKISESAARKQVEEGKIGFDLVQKAFERMTAQGGMFHNMMEKQSKTVEGLTSTLKDNYALAMAAFGEGLNDKLKIVLKSLIDVQGGLDTTKLKEWGQQVGDVVIFLKDMVPSVTKVIALMVTFKTVMAVSDRIDAMRTAWTVASQAFSSAPTIIEGFKGMASSLLGLKKAQEGANVAAAANPYGAMIAVLIMAAEAAYFLYEKLTQLSVSEQAVADSMKELQSKTRDQIQTSKDLFTIAGDVTASEGQRHAAMTKILSLYPQYLGDIKSETQLKGNLAKAQDMVNQKILEQGFAEIKRAKLKEMANQIADAEMKLQEDKEKRAQSKQDYEKSGFLNKLFGGMGQGYADETIKESERAIAKMYETTEKYSTNADAAFLKTGQRLATTAKASFSFVDAEIAKTEKLLSNAISMGNYTLQKELRERLIQLRAEKDKTYADLTAIDTERVQKKEIDEKAQKKAQKDAKDAVKHLNDLRKIAHDETVLQYEAQSLELAARYQNREMTKQDFDRQDIEIEIKKQEAIVKLQDSYLGRFKTHSKEWVDVMKDKQKALHEIEKAKEKQDKALNDDRKAQEEAAIFEYEKQGVEYDIMLSKHLITKEEHAKRELQIEIEKNRKLIEINTDFLSNFKTGSKEYLAAQKAILQEEQRIADATVKLRPKIEDVTTIGKYGEKTDFRGKNTLETRMRDAVEGGMKVETDANKRGKSIFGKDFEIDEKDGQILERKVRMVLNKALELELKKDAMRIQFLKREMEANAKGTDAYEKAAKEKEKLDNQQFKNKERLHAFEQKMLAQGKQAMTEGLQLTLDILGRDAKARKENADKIKLIQSAQVVISGIAEVQKLWAGYADMPVIGQIIAGVLSAIAVGRTVLAVDKIQSTEYYDGGYTHKGSDRTAKPVLVHGNEWVAPAWQVRHPQYRPMIDALEMGRLRGYAQGGYINTTPTVSTMPNYYQNGGNDKMMQALVGEFAGLRSDVAHWNTNLNATVVRDTMERDAKRDAETKRSAAL